MLFSEYYGDYYACVTEIISEALVGELTREKINAIVQKTGYTESALTIPEKLRDGSWPLLTGNCRTPLKHTPPHPVTLLQKRWLKSLLADPRIRLFGVSDMGLEDIEPLFDPGKFIYYDQYSDGDPYEDEGYITRFRLLLQAVKSKRKAEVAFVSHRGKRCVWTVIPYRLEYSATDDKFRLLCQSDKWNNRTLNLGRIRSVRLRETYDPERYPVPTLQNETVVAEITDERNALERAMLQFSYLAKKTERIGEKTYRMTLYYRQEDETELVIKLLSFGPVLKVVEPEAFVSLIRERIDRQYSLQNSKNDPA